MRSTGIRTDGRTTFFATERPGFPMIDFMNPGEVTVKRIRYAVLPGMFILLLIGFFLYGCSFPSTLSSTDAAAFLTSQPRGLENTGQVLFVRAERFFFSSRIKVCALERSGDTWRIPFDPIAAVIGRNGFAPPGEKREGDGRSPTGIFPLKLVFGYGEISPTRMPYRQAREQDLWADDPESPDYNRWVEKGKTTAASFERLRRDDDLYKYGIVIGYNTDPVIKGHGSAIFFHVWRGRGSSTAGCVAVAEDDLLKILAWLEPSAGPMIIMGMDHP